MSASPIEPFIALGQGWSAGSGDIPIQGNSKYYIGISVGGTQLSFVETFVSTDSNDLLVSIYRVDDFTGGSPLIPINRNDSFRGRVSPSFSGAIGVTANPQSQDIFTRLAIKSGRFQAVTTAIDSNADIVFSQDTKYVVEFFNRDGQEKNVDFSAVLYCPVNTQS
jgi:hypothetical protein